MKQKAKNELKTCKKNRRLSKKKTEKSSDQERVYCETEAFEYCSLKEKMAAFKEFENKMKEIKHFCGDKCKCVSLNLKNSRGKEHICQQCGKKHMYYGINHNSLSIWYDDSEHPHYELPPELCDVYDSEKMLITKMSPFIPFHHIKNGTLVLKGHICTFVQDISTVYNFLPIKPNSVEIIWVFYHYQVEINGFWSKNFPCKKFQGAFSFDLVAETSFWLQRCKNEPSNIDCIPEGEYEGTLEPSELHDVASSTKCAVRWNIGTNSGVWM